MTAKIPPAERLPESAAPPAGASTTTLLRAREVAASLLGRIRRRRRSPNGPAARDEEPVFRPDDLVAERYRVVRFIGQGGVGQVYEVHDLELDERVALKTLHSESAASPEVIERFKRELLLARAVTHENVCRLFDLGRHRAGEGEEDRFFVTMELVRGETLEQRIERGGRLPVPEALALASQVALGLGAAHAKGVVHRDVKGSNVLLVPRPDGSTRAVVTDFGLALDASRHDPAVEKPSSSKLEGTPLFMAPEQVRGEALSAATDVYAFGVLLYHALTGRWPFTGDTPLATALARIERDPIPPRRHRAKLTAACEALVLRCLARDPARRFPSAQELPAALAAVGGSSGGSSGTGRRVRASGRRFGLAAAAVALLVAAWAIGARWQARSAGERAAAPAVAARTAVVVLGFENGTGEGDLDWFGTALAEALGSSLSAGGELLVLAGESAAEVRADLGLGPSRLDRQLRRRLARRSGAAWAVSGTYRHAPVGEGEGEGDGGPRLAFEVRLQDTQDERASYTHALQGRADELGGLAERTARELRSHLGLVQPTGRQLASALAELPEPPAAARLYAEGLEALGRADAVAARDRLLAAAELAPDHPLVQARLSDAWFLAGYHREAHESATRALESADRLSREKQLSVEARYHLRLGEWQRAEELFRALREFFPDDLEYGLSLVDAQDRGARLEAALVTVESLRQMPEPWASDPRIDLAEAKVAYHQGDYPRSQEIARRAVEKGRRTGARSLVAAALTHEALNRTSTDRDQTEARRLLDEARAIYDELGDTSGVTAVLFTLAGQAYRRGELDASEKLYREGLALAVERTDEAALSKGRTSLAILLDRRGRLTEGLAAKEEVLASYRRRKVALGEAVMLENLGISLLKLGRLAEARARFDQAAERFEEIGDRIGVAWAPYYQGRVWLDEGELALARASFERARAAAEEHPEGGLGPATEFELVRIELAAGRLAAAAARAEALAGEFETLEQPSDVEEPRLLLARVLSASGELAEAGELARGTRDYFAGEGAAHFAAAAEIELALAALAAPGDPPGAACNALASSLPAIEHRHIRLRGEVALARCARALGTADSAALTERLLAVRAEADELGLFEPSVEAGRALAGLYLADGDRDRTRAALEALRRETDPRGWALATRQVTDQLEALSGQVARVAAAGRRNETAGQPRRR